METKVKFCKLLITLGAYILLLLIVVTGATIERVSRTDAVSLELLGKTVNQAAQILKSEGFSQSEYIFITKDGAKPATSWTVKKVEDARIARLFVESKELPNIESLKIVNLRYNVAESILERSGYYHHQNYTLDSQGESVWMKSSWRVKSVSNGGDSKAPSVILEKIITDSSASKNKSKSTETKDHEILEDIDLKKLFGIKNSEDTSASTEETTK